MADPVVITEVERKIDKIRDKLYREMQTLGHEAYEKKQEKEVRKWLRELGLSLKPTGEAGISIITKAS